MRLDRQKTDNELYKKICENSFKKGAFCNLRYEKQMDYLFEKLKNNINETATLNILDACCGYGRLIYYMNKFDSRQNYFGIDYSEEFISRGKEMFKDSHNIHFEKHNITSLPQEYTKKFDITINYKTLSWLPYYEECIKELIRVTKRKIYITSLFNNGSNETITKMYENADNPSNFTYLNTYSFEKFRNFCIKNGAKDVTFIEMHLDFDLAKSDKENVISTYTETLDNGKKLEITLNTLLNWKLIEIII